VPYARLTATAEDYADAIQFCGLLTVVFSVVVFIVLPDSPMKAKFLKGDDKLLAIERLRMNQMVSFTGMITSETFA
jgi:hypothetical protein